MKTILLFCLTLLSFTALSQTNSGPLKMDLPNVASSENQNFQVISFEPLAQDKFSVLYIQELPATVAGEREYLSNKTLGAFVDQDAKKFVSYSDRVIVLVRQIVSKTAEPAITSWVIAQRELQSDMGYKLFYPSNFVHPIIKNETAVKYSLKNLEQLQGLSAREFEALVMLGKQKYGFYKYPEPTKAVADASIADELNNLKSGFQGLKAALGKGDIPKAEKVLFKREVMDKVRLVATKIDNADSVIVKLYLATSDEANYDLLKSQTFKGSINPNHASVLVYDQSLNVAGAYGYVLLKYKDEKGTDKANPMAIGIDSNGEPQFWKIDAGKNALNSFLPSFSYIQDDELHVISRNSEKVFKPFYQHHVLKKDGTSALLYPTIATDVSSEKFQFTQTGQAKPTAATGYTSSQFSTDSNDEFPVGMYSINKTNYIITGVKSVKNNGETITTSYGNLTVMRIDGSNKIKEIYELVENKSAEATNPQLLGTYPGKAHFMISYPNKFKLVLSEDKAEIEQLENNAYKLVYMANKDYISSNELGSMFITKSIVGNKYVLEFFPSN